MFPPQCNTILYKTFRAFQRLCRCEPEEVLVQLLWQALQVERGSEPAQEVRVQHPSTVRLSSLSTQEQAQAGHEDTHSTQTHCLRIDIRVQFTLKCEYNVTVLNCCTKKSYDLNYIEENIFVIYLRVLFFSMRPFVGTFKTINCLFFCYFDS